MAPSTSVKVVLAAVTLPPIISFSSPSEPLLTLTLTLQQSSRAITLLKIQSPLHHLVNRLTIQNVRTGDEWELPTLDINYSHKPVTRLTRGQAGNFITLRPEEPYQTTMGFRPLGHEIFDKSRAHIVPEGQFKYRWLCFGMHLLEVGEEYTIGFKQGLRIPKWMEGSLDELLVEDGDGESEAARWRPRTGEPIEVVAAGACRFRVEA